MILSALDRREAAVRGRLALLAVQVGGAALRYEAALARHVDRCRAEEHSLLPELGSFEARVAGGPGGGSSTGGGSDPGGGSSTGDGSDPGGGSGARDAAELLGEGGAAALKAFRAAWYELVGVYGARARHRALVAHLEALKHRRQGHVPAPSRGAIRSAIAGAAA